MEFDTGDSDTMMIDETVVPSPNATVVQAVVCDEKQQQMMKKKKKRKDEEEEEDEKALFPYNCLIRGSELMDVAMRLLQVWLSITTVTSSRFCFDFEAKKHHGVDRNIAFIFKTILDHQMFPDEVIYLALCLINKLHQKTGFPSTPSTQKSFSSLPCVLETRFCWTVTTVLSISDYMGGLKNGTIYHFEALFLNAIQWECEVSVDEMVNVVSSLHSIRSTMAAVV